jgi:muramoyltetrapeptide carboxypeptidase
MINKTDIVEIISIGTPCSQDENEKIKNYVKKIGLEPRIFLEKETTVAENHDHEFAVISAELRFKQFRQAIESDAKIIWCSRGGYGSAEILPFLMKMEKPVRNKIFIGFSDITSIGIFLIQQWGWQVISAPLLGQLAFGKLSNQSEKAILDLIFGNIKELKYELEVVEGPYSIQKTLKKSSRMIVGGCTSVIAGNFGTRNQINWEDKLLFLEDEGEDGERLDRYFHQISTTINETKSRPFAIILGNFLEGNPHGTPKAANIEIAIRRFAEKLSDIPLFREKSRSLGHSVNMMPLLIGAQSEITPNNELIQKIA